MPDDLFDLLPYRFEHDVERCQGLGRDSFVFVDQAEEEMFGADIRLVLKPRFFLGEDNGATCPVSEPFEHGIKGTTVRSLAPRVFQTNGERCVILGIPVASLLEVRTLLFMGWCW